jgi:hypothetical protein
MQCFAPCILIVVVHTPNWAESFEFQGSMSSVDFRCDDEESQSRTVAEQDAGNAACSCSSDVVPLMVPDIDCTVMRDAVRKEVSLASEDWYELTLLHDIHKKKPVVVNCDTSVLQVRPAECFTQFFVVLAHHVLTVNPNPTRRASASHSDEDPSKYVVLTFRTLHFVHRTTPDVGYEVQSVWIPGAPLRLQCYPRLNLQYLFMHSMRAQYGEPPKAGEAWDVAKLRLPTSGDVVILGMGGNVMANCLVHLLPPTVAIHVVEIEPAVVAVCSLEGLLPTAPNFHAHVCDVVVALQRLDDASCSLIILDCFDPLEGDMMAHANWLRQVKVKLNGTGVAVVNMHCAPNGKYLSVFVDVFGRGAVEVLEFGASPAQVAIVCAATPVAQVSKDLMNSLAYSMCRSEDMSLHSDALCFVTKSFVVGHKSVKCTPETKREEDAVRVWKCGAV